ncbi:hypothetical protein ASPSYDRAFT_48601 [Aspergillus sydowii CBS 593.65]|uniref:NlpC/P60 domain-containing protein n=1 Tax=Aspergillus sydowii CBS 593.65 TaxID=1036612 RepID=A0A1L9T7I8_9EURO|nr:uncharacterized protein ASPSYDRAFT_48601 [Aspergillus sydowii CBS 593.65]OJJ55399.1 hypothetical protein ASPSYDRAFT_48601 [Aspergillus sydowii CBS 593.65]
MQLTNLFMTLAATLSVANAYKVTTDGLNCRKGASTSDASVTTYDNGEDVNITCQTNGESIQGNTLWDKTEDGCYVSDFYVKTGSDSMVTKDCDGGSDSGSSSYQGEISRDEILERADYWISRHIPYSMSAYYPDPDGRKYRTDCSGFVSMALHASAPGLNTVSLPDIAKSISWDDLQPGDFVGTLGSGTGGADGHVTLFKSWTDSSKEKYNTLECQGTYGCVADKREVGWKVGSHTAKPYRYEKVKD